MVVGTVLPLLAGALILYYYSSHRRRVAETKEIPTVPSWIPFLGSGPAYFMSPIIFTRNMRKKYGDCFYFTVFGQRWLMICKRDDIQSVVTMSESKCSMLKAYLELGGKVLPQNARRGFYSSEAAAMRFDRANTGTPFFIHALRPKRVRAWIPAVRHVLSDSFRSLPKQGEIDLFSWCQELISAVTVRAVMGHYTDLDSSLRDKWVKLFIEADPESAFRSPAASIVSILEVAVLGERRIYNKVREFAMPIVEDEIEQCIAGTLEEDDASVLSSLVRSWWNDVEQDANLLRQARHRIVYDIFTFMFAAFSNSFGAAAWTLFHVLRNTANVGVKVRAELSQVSAESDVTEFVELEKTLLEVCRLYTPGSLLRKLMTNWKMPSSGIEVEKGTTLVVSSYYSMRTAEAFQNPNSFDPTRYDRGEHNSAGCMFLPFGAGTHPCAGKRFANLEIAIFCAEALRQMKLELVDTTYATNRFTKDAIDLENHPNLEPAQIAFIWRPAVPVKVLYELY